ncbi:MAG: GNAT family N-acetyltransferase [Clostridia bacterium]|nr:GNAT family N-acetyltransferase [Clostridia bacterium]
MDTAVNEKDFALLRQDPYTFAVLDRILRGPCELVQTDHERLILCHSGAPYPVWIWTPDGCPEETRARAWELAETLRPLSAGFRYNLKYELADSFTERAAREGRSVGVTMQLFAYDCPEPIPPDKPTDGALYRCTARDVDEIAAMFRTFYQEIGEEPPAHEHLLEKARAYVDQQAFFFWRTAAGQTAACCSYRINQGLAWLGSVCTLPEFRRRHYARHMVYQVTRMVRDAGYMPMLYTDADYPASNACYERIGYVLRGKLCTVGERL